MVGGLPLQRTASLVALGGDVVGDLLFGSLPAVVLELVAVIYGIIWVLL